MNSSITNLSNQLKSPVLWISDMMWSRLNPVIEEGKLNRLVSEPMLVIVEDADKKRSTIWNPLSYAAADIGTLEEIKTRLVATVGTSFGFQNTSWPICCNRPATVIDVEEIRLNGMLEKQDIYFLEGEVKRDWNIKGEYIDILIQESKKAMKDIRKNPIDGILCFHCRNCGRLYLASTHP